MFRSGGSRRASHVRGELIVSEARHSEARDAAESTEHVGKAEGRRISVCGERRRRNAEKHRLLGKTNGEEREKRPEFGIVGCHFGITPVFALADHSSRRKYECVSAETRSTATTRAPRYESTAPWGGIGRDGRAAEVVVQYGSMSQKERWRRPISQKPTVTLKKKRALAKTNGWFTATLHHSPGTRNGALLYGDGEESKKNDQKRPPKVSATLVSQLAYRRYTTMADGSRTTAQRIAFKIF